MIDLNSVLETEIYLPHSVCIDEANYLVEQHETALLALDAFIKGQIDFEDYADILELCGMDMDEYLLGVEENLSLI